MSETFSIVIPVYNRASVLERTLRSVAAQTWRPLHLVLVDNASTDSSLRLMTRWAEANRAPDLEVTVIQERKPGAAAARNRGLAEVRSEHMLFFDSDDELLPEAVSHYMAAFMADPSLDLALTACTHIGADGRRRVFGPRGGDPLTAHIHHCTLRTQGYAARTEVIRRAGGWDERTRIWDDWELGIRLLLVTDRIKALPVTSCVIHASEECLTGTRYRDKAEHYETPITAAREALEASSRPDAGRLAAMMDYRRMTLAALFAKEGDMELAGKWKEAALRHARGRRRWLLKAAYAYIRRGGRGFDRVISRLY